MYQKIYDPILKSFIPIQSNYGIKTLKNYIGGANVKPRFEKKLISDFMKKIDPKTKNFPHYIKDNRCIPIYKKIQIPFEIKTHNPYAGRIQYTLLEKIRLFYTNVFNIRKSMIDVKTQNTQYIYDNLIRCNIFLNKDSETPEKFKKKIDKLDEKCDKFIENASQISNEINSGEIGILAQKIRILLSKPRNTDVSQICSNFNLFHNIEDTMQNAFEDYRHLQNLIENIRTDKKIMNGNLKGFFNFTWKSIYISKNELIADFYNLNRNIDKINLKLKKYSLALKSLQKLIENPQKMINQLRVIHKKLDICINNKPQFSPFEIAFRNGWFQPRMMVKIDGLTSNVKLNGKKGKISHITPKKGYDTRIALKILNDTDWKNQSVSHVSTNKFLSGERVIIVGLKKNMLLNGIKATVSREDFENKLRIPVFYYSKGYKIKKSIKPENLISVKDAPKTFITVSIPIKNIKPI
uniref:Uncharacterized protein n=1 Tax=viral metagenome TaxID=1070528 RepID=A0A6C0J127_9ZZZZ